jgi:hypothetical protein
LANDYEWNNTNGNWNLAGNWKLAGGPPATGENAILSGAVANTTTVSDN